MKFPQTINSDIINHYFHDIIVNANAYNYQSQITLGRLFDELNQSLTQQEKKFISEKCYKIDSNLDLSKDYYKVIFLKIYIANKNKIKKERCSLPKCREVEEKIKKFINQNKFSQLFEFLDLNYSKRLYCNIYVKQYFKLLSILKTEILNNSTLKMYFCDLLFPQIDSEKRVEKLAKELSGVQGSNVLSSLQSIFETHTELCDFIGSINQKFDQTTEIEHLFDKSKELYFSEHRFNLENAEEQFLKVINKKQKELTMATLDKHYEKLINRHEPNTSGNLDKYQNTKIVYQSLKQKIEN